MKCTAFAIFCLIIPCVLPAQPWKQKFISEDIGRFWEAYDKIISTTDTVKQAQYLEELYFRKATEGLTGLREVRRYAASDYLTAIRKYPKFWNSVRKLTFSSGKIEKTISGDINKLHAIYPTLGEVPIYFAVGVFRTNGTIHGQKVLIGAELALADKSIDITELPDHPKEFFIAHTPIKDIGLLCTHEYVHTQQRELVHNLLTYCIYEGVAEFVSTFATGKKSYSPAIAFGNNNYIKIRDQFENDVFIPSTTYNWLWSGNRIFGQRDLGYSVGYEMARRYYEKAADKKSAIKELIELDFANEKAVENFVDASGYLSLPLTKLYENFEKKRPTVTSITPTLEGIQADQSMRTITVHFSEPMDKTQRGFDYGPLGEPNVLMVQNVIGFSEDGKSFTYEVKLEPGKQYQTVISSGFTNVSGIPLKPFLIDFTTKE